MYRFASLVLCCALLGSASAVAEVLPLKDAVRIAKLANPNIKSLESQLASAKAKARQSLAPTEPNFSVQFNDMAKAYVLPDTASTVFSFVQPFAFPGKAWVNQAALQQQAQNIFYQLKAAELDISNTVKTAYFQLALANRTRSIIEESKSAYEHIYAIAKRRYEGGDITQVDLINAQIALLSNLNDLADWESGQKTARAQLNYLLNYAPDAPTEIEALETLKSKAAVPLSLAEARNKMQANRPEIRSAFALREAAENALSLAKLAFLPDFQLTLGFTNYNIVAASPIASITTQSLTYLAGLQASIPLWGAWNEGEALNAASYDRASADSDLMSIRLQSDIDLFAALQVLDALQKKIHNYESHLLVASEQAFKIALISYSSGKIDYQALSDAAATKRQIQTDYYSRVGDYLTSSSALGQLIGEELP